MQPNLQMKPHSTPILTTHNSHKCADRFLPNRSSSNLLTSFDMVKEDKSPSSLGGVSEDQQAGYSALLKTQLLQRSNSILNSNSLFKYSQDNHSKENIQLGFSGEELYSPLKSQRSIPKSPYKVLDAPSLQDDFYLNLLDWSSHNTLSVGLGSCVYL